ncbi:hypothetical protein [Nostoc sp. DedQUE07]|uniref:hypothetical protein n=1 Tax=Nostoc sp. DedQUE07 TaxID=3075392 RepID=UPI002AD4ECB4|nr:hypothetical protein [Nostoc sp. DedQUE07]MDZ8131965.1 hypothetical protein [Nostoc sp. DedQUE07]
MITSQIEEVHIGQIDKWNWGKAWNRMNRMGYSVSQLEMIIAESKVDTQLIAASLIWASLVPSEEVFEQTVKLALANPIDELWQAYYSAASRKGFVGVVLAIVHYDLLIELNSGEYYPWIEVIYKDKGYWRRHPNHKHNYNEGGVIHPHFFKRENVI